MTKNALISGAKRHRPALKDPGAYRVDHSSYITGTELFVDGGLAHI
jgi:hypothetical protein